jgi:hypothetical protein
VVENSCSEKVEILIGLHMYFDQKSSFQSSYPLILQVSKDCGCGVGRFRGNQFSGTGKRLKVLRNITL